MYYAHSTYAEMCLLVVHLQVESVSKVQKFILSGFCQEFERETNEAPVTGSVWQAPVTGWLRPEQLRIGPGTQGTQGTQGIAWLRLQHPL